MPWYDAPRLHLALFAIVIVALIAGPTFAALRRRRASHARSRAWRTMAVSVLALELSALTLLVGIAAVMATTDTWEFQYGLPPLLRWLVRLSPVTIVLAAVAVGSSALVVSRREGSARRRGLYVMRAIAGVTLVALLWYWQVLP